MTYYALCEVNKYTVIFEWNDEKNKISEIDKVCYYTNTYRLVNINREIGKI